MPAKRFPRTRGDGPAISSPCSATYSFPPHARGWTVGGRRIATIHSVSPARAGMDLLRRGGGLVSASFPRTRGDGPSERVVWLADEEFPPHARGWTARRHCRAPGSVVSPARAGMDPFLLQGVDREGIDVSPARAGMDPSGRAARLPQESISFPPHARGWTRAPCRSVSRLTLRFPPHARGWTGSSYDAGCPSIRRHRFPRTRGDGPCSSCRAAHRYWRCFPRTRGDGPVNKSRDSIYRSGFPPHARGMDPGLDAPTKPADADVSPARAGMDLAQDGLYPSVRRFPARAGMDLVIGRGHYHWRRFPRTRGDGPSVRCRLLQRFEWKFPPHARGWTAVNFWLLRWG